jgi:predicted heme/steroid binding protein
MNKEVKSMKMQKLLFILVLGLTISLAACDLATTTTTGSLTTSTMESETSASTTTETTSQTTTATTAPVTTTTTTTTAPVTTTTTTTTAPVTTTTTTTTAPLTTTTTTHATTTTTLRVFSLVELATFNGNNGSAAYIAINGTVYDVTHASEWSNGWHKGMHLAGTDASSAFGDSPHSRSILSSLPIVGTLGN